MNPLVSVIVVCYNSSSYVLETLESISKQTWKDMELIITDDCSTDNTVSLCEEWLKDNQSRFVRTELLTSETNTGVSTNANRGLFSAKGDWITLPAGDDALKPRCIEDNMIWIRSHPEIRALFSRIDVYQETFDAEKLLRTIPGDVIDPDSILAPIRSAESQYRMLLLCDRIHFTPSAFLCRETILSVGGFDERFKMLEDYPMWLSLTREGHKLYFMEEVTMNYREHQGAINNTGAANLVNPNYFRHEGFRRIYIYPCLPLDIRLHQRYRWYAKQLFRWRWLNRNRGFNRTLFFLLTVYMSPFKYVIWLHKQLDPKLKDNELYL